MSEGAVREPVVYVRRRHGAWLVSASTNVAQNWTVDEQFDCAAALPVAKRLARELAVAADCTSLRWEHQNEATWVLVGIEPATPRYNEETENWE